jgi:hypothetical protein
MALSEQEQIDRSWVSDLKDELEDRDRTREGEAPRERSSSWKKSELYDGTVHDIASKSFDHHTEKTKQLDGVEEVVYVSDRRPGGHDKKSHRVQCGTRLKVSRLPTI